MFLLYSMAATALFVEVKSEDSEYLKTNERKWGNLYRTLDVKRKAALHWTTVFLIRRFLLALVLVLSGTLVL